MRPREGNQTGEDLVAMRVSNGSRGDNAPSSQNRNNRDLHGHTRSTRCSCSMNEISSRNSSTKDQDEAGIGGDRVELQVVNRAS